MYESPLEWPPEGELGEEWGQPFTYRLSVGIDE